MKQIQTELPNFTIYEQGELVTEPLVIKAAQVAGNVAVEALSAISKPVGRVLGEMATSFQLDMHDAAHGTHLRQEYFQRKRELATAALREEVGL